MGRRDLIFSGSKLEMLFKNVYQVFVDKTSLTAKCVFNLNFYVQIGINKLNDKLVVVKEEKIKSDLPSKEKILGNKPSDQQ